MEQTMTTFNRRRIKNLFEGLTGYDIERVGDKSLALFAGKHRSDAWFSYDAQLRTLFEELEIDMVIDVGANEGQFARNLRFFYSGEICSFEPVSCVFAQLEVAASFDRNWHVYNFALGSQESTQTINVHNYTVFSSFLKTNDYSVKHFGDQVTDKRSERVPVRRLDNVLGQIAPGNEDRRIFIKIDTQGYDTEVFKGIGNKLKYVSAFQSELSLIPIYEGMPHWTESIAIYERNDFGVVGMFPVTRDSLRIIEYDCLLKRVTT
jgi:FkbM family methyltransferase